MATVTTTKSTDGEAKAQRVRPSRSKAAIKERAALAQSEQDKQPEQAEQADDREWPPVNASTLTPADIAMVGEIAAKAATAAVQAAIPRALAHGAAMQDLAIDATDPEDTPSRTPGGKVVEQEVFDTPPLTLNEIADMSPEDVEAYNKREALKLKNRKRVQAGNIKAFGDMSTSERVKHLNAVRDPNVIRRALPDDWDGDEDDLVRVVCKRRIGLGGNRGMSDIDETLDMPRVSARALQKNGVVEVSI